MKFPRLSGRSWLLVILAGALALRVAALGRADLWTDEIQTLHAVQLGWADLVAERLRAGHVPLYFVLEKAWCAAFGTSQLALRLPSAVFGTLLIVPARSLFRRLAGDAVAWWGAAIVAVHPLFIELSREARMYSLLGLAALVVADRLVAALDGERPGRAFWIALALGPFIHPTWGFAAAPLAAWMEFESRTLPEQRRLSVRTALVGIVASVAVLLVALWFAHPQRQVLARRPWPREIGVFVLRIFSGSELRLLLDNFFSGLLVVGWGIALVFGFLDADPRARRFALWIGVGVPAASVAAGLLGGVPWGPARYLEFGAVAFVLLAAISARSHHPPAAALAVGLLLVTLSIGQLRPDRTAWSDAANSLRDDPSPVVVDDEPSRIVLSHYLGRDVFVGAPPAGTAGWRHAALDVSGDRRRVRIDAEPRPR